MGQRVGLSWGSSQFQTKESRVRYIHKPELTPWPQGPRMLTNSPNILKVR